MKKNKSQAIAVTRKIVKQEPSHAHNLSTQESDRFDELENQIKANLQASFLLAAALAEIRENKLYRESFDTFEEYCKTRWDYSRSYCARLADMNSVLTDLKPYANNQVYPQNEAQARVFVPLAKNQRIALLETVFKESETDMTTAAELIKYRKKLFPDNIKPEKVAVGVKPGVNSGSGANPLPPIPNTAEIIDAGYLLLKELEDDEYSERQLAVPLRKFLELLTQYENKNSANKNN